MGVPLSAVMAFWISSPLIDPSMFVLTAGVLGPDFAVAKTLAAIAIGLAGGYSTLVLSRRGVFADALRKGVGEDGCRGAHVRKPARVAWRLWREPARRRAFAYQFAAVSLFLGKWLALAFTLESLMLAYIPAEAVGAVLGGDSAWAVPAAVVIGVPTYLNGYAALGLVDGLTQAGMAAGTGPDRQSARASP